MTSPFPRLPFVIWAVSMCMMVADVVAEGRNPMSRPAAGEIVPVGEPYDITWKPGTTGPVFIALLGETEEGTGNLTCMSDRLDFCSKLRFRFGADC